MVSLSITPSRAPVHEIASTLADEDEIPLSVTHQIMAWFGEVNLREDKWAADVKLIVREIGLGLLREHGLGSGIENDAFLEKWKTAVSDKFEDLVEMELLSVRILISCSLMHCRLALTRRLRETSCFRLPLCLHTETIPRPPSNTSRLLNSLPILLLASPNYSSRGRDGVLTTSRPSSPTSRLTRRIGIVSY